MYGNGKNQIFTFGSCRAEILWVGRYLPPIVHELSFFGGGGQAHRGGNKMYCCVGKER